VFKSESFRNPEVVDRLFSLPRAINFSVSRTFSLYNRNVGPFTGELDSEIYSHVQRISSIPERLFARYADYTGFAISYLLSVRFLA